MIKVTSMCSSTEYPQITSAQITSAQITSPQVTVADMRLVEMTGAGMTSMLSMEWNNIYSEEQCWEVMTKNLHEVNVGYAESLLSWASYYLRSDNRKYRYYLTCAAQIYEFHNLFKAVKLYKFILAIESKNNSCEKIFILLDKIGAIYEDLALPNKAQYYYRAIIRRALDNQHLLIAAVYCKKVENLSEIY